MALIDDLRDNRGDAISTYYSAYTDWETRLAEDGNNTYTSGEDGQFQAKYYAFNTLINRHHSLLSKINGYAVGSSSILDADEGSVSSSEWWSAVDPSNARAQLFITDRDYAAANDSLFVLNNQSSVNQRHPYMLWNQYHTSFGSYDNRGWKNTNSRADYSDTQNPISSGTNYRLAEPLEWHGNSSNVIWSKVVFNGYFHYRRERLKNISYTTTDDAGFYSYLDNDIAIDIMLDPFTESNYWPSPFGVMRHAHWGDGSNTTLASVSISNASASSFTQAGDTSSSWNIGDWYAISDTGATQWALFRISDVNVGATETEITCEHIEGALFSGTSIDVLLSPRVLSASKETSLSDIHSKLWNHVYDEHYSRYKTEIDNISQTITGAINDALAITNFDYTPINEESGEDIGKPEASSFLTDLQNWLQDWKTLVGDTGSGATYSTFDAKWSDSNLDALAVKLKELLDFSGSYNDTRIGILGEWVETTSPSILGDYSLGGDESWDPSEQTSGQNNTGDLGGGQQLYVYRHSVANQRANRNDGILFQALGAYKTWNQKVVQINEFESRMSSVTIDSKYDITPTVVEASQDAEDAITISWDGVKAASSYDVEMKEGLSGSWQPVVAELGYNDPGANPPDFSQAPTAEYVINAFVRGYQEFGLSFSSVDDSTGLPEDFTVFDFYLDLNGTGATRFTLKGLDCSTWEALRVTLQNKFDDNETEAQVLAENGDLRIRSNKKGIGSTVDLSAGTDNDLFSNLSATPEPPVDGTEQLEQGKVYYFRVRTNNGYQIQLGNNGDRNDKDWNSQSEWSTENYTGDRAIHGDAGIITWDEPTELTVSGFPVDNSLTPSDQHIRIEWQAAVNAESYRVYRSTAQNGGYALIGSTSNLYYEDSSSIPGVVYYYKLRAMADTDFQLYEEDGDNLSDSLTSDLTPAGVRGRRLWQSISLTATTTNSNAVVLDWTTLPGANAFVLYTSNMENGQYNFISTDDGQERLFVNQTYVHKTPAEQFLASEFQFPSDGIPASDYSPNTRYYFIVIVGEESGEVSVKQYYIVSPASGEWASQDIADAINTAIAEGANNATCSLIHFENPSEFYKIKFSSNSTGENASIQITGGTFGESLLNVVGDVSKSQPGAGAYPGMVFYYQVEALEIISGEIMRRSERSNIARGERPLL